MDGLIGINNETYASIKLKEEAKKRNINLECIFEIKEKKDKYDFIINRAFTKETYEYNKISNYQYNDFLKGYAIKDKRNQILNFDIGIKKPKTIIKSYLDTYEIVSSYLGPIFIGKKAVSYGGKDVFLIKNKYDFEAYKECDFYQEYIESSKGKDLRLFIIGGEIIASMIRENKNDFRSNISQGGIAKEFFDIDNLKENAKLTYTKYNLDIVGIDLLFGEEGYYFCEINNSPGLDILYNINLASNIMDYIEKKQKGL